MLTNRASISAQLVKKKRAELTTNRTSRGVFGPSLPLAWVIIIFTNKVTYTHNSFVQNKKKLYATFGVNFDMAYSQLISQHKKLFLVLCVFGYGRMDCVCSVQRKIEKQRQTGSKKTDRQENDGLTCSRSSTKSRR